MRKISSEKINYAVFFVVAAAIVSAAIYIEKPESLVSAISFGDEPEGDGDGETADDNAQAAQTQEGPEGDGDGETADD